MAVSHLRVVSVGDKRPPSEFLSPTLGRPLAVTLEEHRIRVPLISMLLYRHYTLGALIDTQSAYAVQVSATIPFLWHGLRHCLVGAAVPLVEGPDLVVARGLLDQLG